MALNSERNTKSMEARVLRAFRKWHRKNRVSQPTRGNIAVFFEHGHWWAEEVSTGAQWSACDAEGSGANGVFDGFCFEQVSQGEE
jgi:hypothetical protein